MWIGKSSLKAAALVLVGAISSMAAESSISPLTFGASTAQQEVNNWNYLTKFKLWGTTGIQFGWRPEFYDTRYYNKSVSNYNGVNILDSLGWVGTATGDLSHESEKNGGWLDGPIIVGGSITAQQMTFVTGPVRTGKGSVTGSFTSCSGTNNSGNCSYDKVPEIRSGLKVPTLSGVNWSNYSALSLNKKDAQRKTIINISNSGQPTCTDKGICDLFFSSIDFDEDNRLVIQMPDGGRITRIFTNKLTTKTHPQIVVNYGDGDLDATGYEGNLMVYVNSDVSFSNTDYADFTGTYVVNGTLTGKSNMTVTGQFIANKIIIGDDFKAQNFVFKPFVVWPELSILGNDAIKFKESDSWQSINVALSSESTEPVSFEYCFQFQTAAGVPGQFAGYADVGEADANHKFPICNKNQTVKVTIPVGETKAAGINIMPLIDGLIENDEQLWFQVKNLTGAQLASDYENDKGYKIYIISNDELPTVSGKLVVNVAEDSTHVFNEGEFKFSHKTQKFASVIITSVPIYGSLFYNKTKLTSVGSGKEIKVKDLANLTYKADENAFGSGYASFKYKVVGDGVEGGNTSIENTATVNVIPINDKPTVADVIFTVNELDHTVAGGPITITDVSNERNVDTYSYKLVDVSGSDYTAFNSMFEISKLSNQNATIKVKSNATLNYTQKQQYVVYATVTDNAKTETSESQKFADAGAKTSNRFKITVKINNENEPPTIKDQEFTIAEKQDKGSNKGKDWPSGTFVGDVIASDPDGDQLTYSIKTTGVPFKFENNSSKLVIKNGSDLDYETKPTWKFEVSVTDGNLSNTATITVHLTNVNEGPEKLLLSNEYSVNENTATGKTIGSFTVFDPDAGDKLTYTLTGVLTGAFDVTTAKKNLSDIFKLEESKNQDGTRTVSINVKNSALLDYEKLYKKDNKNAKYQALISVKDSDGLSVSKTTNIIVKDVDEKVYAKGGSFYLNEHSPTGSPVCAVEYKDANGNPLECSSVARVVGSGDDVFSDVDVYTDNDSFNKLTYSIIASKNTGTEDYKRFTVNRNTGALYTDDEFDFETEKNTFTFVVTVSDGNFTADAKVVVNLENIKEPTITAEYKGDVTVEENTAEGEVVVNFVEILEKIKAENSEVKNELEKIKGPISFTIVYDKDDPDFYVEANTIFAITTIGSKASVKVKDPTKLNFEALYSSDETKDKTTYKVIVKAYGKQENGIGVEVPISMGITVTDINEDPTIVGASLSDEIKLPAGVTKGDFEIYVPETWTSADDYFGKVDATDMDNAYGSLHPYGFNKLTYRVDEVIAVDGSTDFPFELNPNTGKFTVVDGKVLDHTKQSLYKCVVTVKDNPKLFEEYEENGETKVRLKYPAQSATHTIEIRVTDVNRPSEFRVLTNPYDVDEKEDVGTSLNGKKIVVYDEDDADLDELVISITDKNGNCTSGKNCAQDLFEVVQEGKTDKTTHLSTFVIKTKAGIDYEALYNETDAEAAFDITLTIIDTELREKYPQQGTKIQVNDVNEEPAFTKTPYEFTVPEDVAKETVLGVAVATDPDIYNAKFGTLYFSLEGDDAAPFDIKGRYNSADGLYYGDISVSKTAKLDYEIKKSYEFDAVVTDKGYTKRERVIVTIKDVDETPVFTKIPDLDVDENSDKGTIVGVVTADDDDCKNNNTCKKPIYTLAATDIVANDYNSFKINPTTGTITVNGDLDYETKSEYSVRVVATDGDNTALSAFVDVIIKINDVNDKPVYKETEYVFEVHEKASKGEFVGSVVAEDQDTWTVLSYALSDYAENSKEAAAFKITDGKIYVNTSSLDYEKKDLYQIVVMATDNGKSYGQKIGRTDFKDLTATTLVTIKLIDDPDEPKIDDDGKKSYDVAENTVDNNTPNGTEIACYGVSDQDKGQLATLVPYVTDVGNTDADRIFDAKIKNNKLCLIVKDASKLNYEANKHVHKITVEVMDTDNLTAKVEKTINLIDVNEMPIISGSTIFSFYENKGQNYAIGRLYSDDIDTSKAFTQNVFAPIGGDTDLFTITKDGWIQTKRDFDYEKEKRHEFELDVSLADKDSKTYPKLKTTTTVKITLKDMPEFPEITSTEFSVKENSKGGTPIGVLEAVDPDGDTDFLFSLAEDNPYVSVYTTGEIKVLPGAKIDYEQMQKFTIKVSVKDQDGMSSDKDIVIKVIDVNEAPTIKPQEFTFPEDSEPGTKKGPVKADDPDKKNPDFRDLKFYPVEEDKTFDVKENGDIVLKGELDYEKQKSYDIEVYVTDGEFNDTTVITVNVGNIIEKTKVQITRAEVGDSVYHNPDTVYTNKSEILVEWKQSGKTKSSVDPLKEGKNVIIKKYKDPTCDIEGSDTLIVFYSTAAPIVDVDAKKTKVEADNIYTIVEGVDKKDSSIYVNKNNKDVKVSVKDTVSGYEETFSVDVVLDTVAMPNSVVKTLVDISKSQPSLDKNPKTKVNETPINGDKTRVSYVDVVNGDSVTISYYVDNDGEMIKQPVVGSNGKKKNTAVIEVSKVVVVKGKEVVVSYKADAESGEILYGDSEGNLMVDVPESSSSKEEKKVVDLKTGVGAFTVTYDAEGVEGNKATVSYVIDEKGKIVANDEGDRGYLVTYTYTNRYGNSADRSVFMVLDKIAPKVVIKSPKKDAVLYANYVDVDWCIAVDGDMDNCVKQDTLNFQSLNKGVNTIKRVYRDKAGNETIATVDVMMKKSKDVNINLEKPMVIVSIDSVNKYYEANPPEEDQTFAVSILNPNTQKEKEVVKGFSGDTKKGSGEEPYAGYDGHIGPTVKIDMKLPLVSAVGGLATLDDIIINGDMIPLEGVDAKDSKKVTVKEYVEEYCSTEFQESVGKSKDYSKANLYSTKARVTLWFYTTGGQFVDKYRFEYDINDPDYVDKAGLVKFFFEMKPDMNGELRDANGRLYGTGPYIVKTEVELRSKLRCVVPPVNKNSKIGDVLKSSDEMTKRFGYRRPVLRGNEKKDESPKKENKKNSKKKSSSDDED